MSSELSNEKEQIRRNSAFRTGTRRYQINPIFGLSDAVYRFVRLGGRPNKLGEPSRCRVETKFVASTPDALLTSENVGGGGWARGGLLTVAMIDLI